MEEATQWLERYREFWEASFLRLDDLLAEMKTTSMVAKKQGATPSARKGKRKASASDKSHRRPNIKNTKEK